VPLNLWIQRHYCFLKGRNIRVIANATQGSLTMILNASYYLIFSAIEK